MITRQMHTEASNGWLGFQTERFHLFLKIIHVITARKRSLGQGNKFTGVCLSIGGEVPDQVHPAGTRYTPPGPDIPQN